MGTLHINKLAITAYRWQKKTPLNFLNIVTYQPPAAKINILVDKIATSSANANSDIVLKEFN